jgi:hypothetical protein
MICLVAKLNHLLGHIMVSVRSLLRLQVNHGADVAHGLADLPHRVKLLNQVDHVMTSSQHRTELKEFILVIAIELDLLGDLFV